MKQTLKEETYKNAQQNKPKEFKNKPNSKPHCWTMWRVLHLPEARFVYQCLVGINIYINPRFS